MLVRVACYPSDICHMTCHGKLHLVSKTMMFLSKPKWVLLLLLLVLGSVVSLLWKRLYAFNKQKLYISLKTDDVICWYVGPLTKHWQWTSWDENTLNKYHIETEIFGRGVALVLHCLLALPNERPIYVFCALGVALKFDGTAGDVSLEALAKPSVTLT